MRDLDCTASWSDTLSFRVQYQEARTLLTNYDVDTETTAPAQAASGAKRGSVSKNKLETNSHLSDCKIMRSSPRSLTALRSLPQTSPVLLLTPVITLANADKSATKSGSIDPFESLGRELSKQHNRLRHVPYVPRVGMTATHAAFIEQAAAVVVVVCESNDSDGQSLEQQQSFADAVAAKQQVDLSGEDDDDDDDTTTPFVVIRFDSNGEGCTDEEYKNVLHAPALTRTSTKKAAQLLFKTEQ
jgi:hypothetical protein